jgi:hypothetical protein
VDVFVEDAGRLELWLSQPVTRSAVFVGRVVAVVGWQVGASRRPKSASSIARAPGGLWARTNNNATDASGLRLDEAVIVISAGSGVNPTPPG